MSWEFDVASSTVGIAAAVVGVALTAYKGIQYQSYLPKKAVNESLESLREQAERVEHQLDQKREQLAQAELTISKADALQSELQSMRKEASELQAARVEFGTLSVQIRSLQEQRTQLEQARSSLQADIRDLSKDRDLIQQQLDSQRTQLLTDEQRRELAEKARILQNDINGKETVLERLAEQVNANDKQIAQQGEKLRELNRELAQVEGKFVTGREMLAGLSKQEEQLRAQIEDLKRYRDNLQRESGSGTKEVRRLLLESVLPAGDFMKPRSGDKREEDAVKAALQAIRNEGLIYAERTIWAFHTALKCEKESPLVVLAGLSGTGKSALPRAYARALGMHQLTVAVQPGWDSPSDLLGFYNHLERQFKPTELTRALVQMNPRHEEGDGVRTDLSQRMLLVLLDEMNLARVEYYFSEFLSRLEARRGIKLEDRSRLRDATVPLELGLGSDGATASYPLLVWKNVLFVGTMNEDESTQTLSDKVIDRSNLLRFGKPGKLHGADDTPRDSAGPAVREYLAYETWQRWCQGTGDGSAFDKEINELNDLLEIVHRPFGHRVSTSIRRYISFYPRWTDKAEQWAFADQIEFRILPRLRGLDLADGEVDGLFQYLEVLCRERLDDVALAKAIRQHREHGDASGQFHWRGLDRTIEEA
jgi:predicted  nucleic acid-binding Zn-ribbon protein